MEQRAWGKEHGAKGKELGAKGEGQRAWRYNNIN